MKKVKLKALEAGAKELLSREQLKNVLGGSGSGGGTCSNNVCGVFYEGGQVGNGFCGSIAGESCHCIPTGGPGLPIVDDSCA